MTTRAKRRRNRKTKTEVMIWDPSQPITPEGDTVEERLKSLMKHPLYHDPNNRELYNHVTREFARAYPGPLEHDASGKPIPAQAEILPEEVLPFIGKDQMPQNHAGNSPDSQHDIILGSPQETTFEPEKNAPRPHKPRIHENPFELPKHPPGPLGGLWQTEDGQIVRSLTGRKDDHYSSANGGNADHSSNSGPVHVDAHDRHMADGSVIHVEEHYRARPEHGGFAGQSGSGSIGQQVMGATMGLASGVASQAAANWAYKQGGGVAANLAGSLAGQAAGTLVGAVPMAVGAVPMAVGAVPMAVGAVADGVGYVSDGIGSLFDSDESDTDTSTNTDTGGNKPDPNADRTPPTPPSRKPNEDPIIQTAPRPSVPAPVVATVPTPGDPVATPNAREIGWGQPQSDFVVHDEDPDDLIATTTKPTQKQLDDFAKQRTEQEARNAAKRAEWLDDVATEGNDQTNDDRKASGVPSMEEMSEKSELSRSEIEETTKRKAEEQIAIGREAEEGDLPDGAIRDVVEQEKGSPLSQAELKHVRENAAKAQSYRTGLTSGDSEYTAKTIQNLDDLKASNPTEYATVGSDNHELHAAYKGFYAEGVQSGMTPQEAKDYANTQTGNYAAQTKTYRAIAHVDEARRGVNYAYTGLRSIAGYPRDQAEHDQQHKSTLPSGVTNSDTYKNKVLPEVNSNMKDASDLASWALPVATQTYHAMESGGRASERARNVGHDENGQRLYSASNAVYRVMEDMKPGWADKTPDADLERQADRRAQQLYRLIYGEEGEDK